MNFETLAVRPHHDVCPFFTGKSLSVGVRDLTGSESSIDAIWLALFCVASTEPLLDLWALLSVVDGDGARLFTYHDIATLGEKSAKALDRIFSKAMELSGLRDEDVAELAENFDATPDAGSSSN